MDEVRWPTPNTFNIFMVDGHAECHQMVVDRREPLIVRIPFG